MQNSNCKLQNAKENAEKHQKIHSQRKSSHQEGCLGLQRTRKIDPRVMPKIF